MTDQTIEHRTGGSTPSQYRLDIPYRHGIAREAECGDVADALNLNGNMYEAFKAIWRLEDKDGPVYNLNKVIWFARREQLRRGHITQDQFWEYCNALVGNKNGAAGISTIVVEEITFFDFAEEIGLHDSI